jgi:hypothetical protein
LIACAGRGGTISEIALALKNGRPVIVLNFDVGDLFASYGERLRRASTPEEAVEMARQALE